LRIEGGKTFRYRREKRKKHALEKKRKRNPGEGAHLDLLLEEGEKHSTRSETFPGPSSRKELPQLEGKNGAKEGEEGTDSRESQLLLPLRGRKKESRLHIVL